jgi:hypothetical protein
VSFVSCEIFVIFVSFGGFGMAPTSAVAHASVLGKRAQKPQLEKEGGRGRVSLDGWVCQPGGKRPDVRAAATSARPQFSFAASHTKTALRLDVSFKEGDGACARESGCETPKSDKHRIPVVDVDACPPAPKKPRARGRMSILCSLEREGSNLLQKLGYSPGYLF